MFLAIFGDILIHDVECPLPPLLPTKTLLDHNKNNQTVLFYYIAAP